MAGNRKLTVEILGDAKGFAGAVRESETHLSRFGSSLGKAAKTAGLAIAGLGVGAAAAVPKLLETGAKLDVIAKKSATVFEDSLPQVQDWAKGVAHAMGLTKSEAIGLASNMGDLLKPMGFTSKQAADMSTQLVDLSGALSAWTGGTISSAEASDTLAKALLGERDGLKGLGIAISEADVSARLAANGTDKLTGAALEQAKAQATLELIMAKSTDAQKAWTNGSMDGIKAQNEAKAATKELGDAFSTAVYPALQALLPLVQSAAEWIGTHMPGAIEAVKGFINDRLVPAFQAVIDVGAAVVGWVQQHWDQISSTVSTAIDKIRAVIESVVGWIQSFWRTFGDEITTVARATWDTIYGVVKGAIETVRGVIETVTALIRGDWSAVWDGIKGIVSGAWQAIRSIVSGAADALKAAISAAMTVIAGVMDSAWSGIKTATSNAIGAIVDFVRSLPGKAGEALAALPQVLTTAFTTGFDAAKKIAKEALDLIIGFVKELPGRLVSLVGSIAGAGERLGGALLDGIKSGAKAVASVGSAIADGITSAFKAAWNAVANWINDKIPNDIGVNTPFGRIGIDLPDNPLPTFHTGGIARGSTAGAEVAAILKDGEAVFTGSQQRALVDALTSNAGRRPDAAGVTYNVSQHFNGVTDHVGLARQSAREMAWRLRML